MRVMDGAYFRDYGFLNVTGKFWVEMSISTFY